ncbi:hypothetical protein BDQ17DRAFT_1230041 [Cyathus striatus]|nr:hypothetical protein BDQ17DRAFT_1230041 [Cyathus striatus]
MPESFVLTGYYKLLFLYLEPLSSLCPILMVRFSGPEKWYNTFVPGMQPARSLEPGTEMAIWQLANSYFALCLVSTFMLRAVRTALPKDLVAQERIIGATLMALGTADIFSVLISWALLPQDTKYSPSTWSSTTHGNITFCSMLLISRIGWLYGVGRKLQFYN